MTLEQNRGLRGAGGRFSRPVGRVCGLLLAFCLAGGVAVQAQFSGPALAIPSPAGQTGITTDPALLYPAARDYKIGVGDLLAIHLYGTLDYAPIVRVSLDGSVQLPLIGIVPVQGLSLHEAEDVIAERLRTAGMYRNPQITISVTESPNQLATVTGEMHAAVPIIGTRRLLDVLAAGGGLPTSASHTITISRPGQDEPIVVNLGTDPARSAQANIPIFPGDTIIVPRVGVVYVLGAFKTPGAIPILQNSPLTLMQVTAIAGGAGYEGKQRDLRIIRTVGLDRKVVRVDIGKVINGRAPDPVLQADDIVFLPTDAMKAAIKSGGVSTLLGIASLLVFSVHP